MKAGTRNVIVICIAGAALIGGLLWGLRRPAQPTQVAKNQAEALLKLDGDALWAMADPTEVETMGWTKEKAVRYLDRFVFPAFKGLTRISKNEVPEARSGGDQGSVIIILATPKGHRFELETTADRRNNGAYAWLQSLIVQAWFIQYMDKHNVDFGSGMWIPARLEGLRRDRPALEAMGVKGMYVGPDDRPQDEIDEDRKQGLPPRSPIKPFDQVEKELVEAGNYVQMIPGAEATPV
jgi:hypothetical protein